MHELAVTQSIIQVVTEVAEANGASQITAVHLVIGDLSSFVDESVQFYFDLLSPGTPAEGARLVFRRESAQAQCLDCGHRFQVTPPLVAQCPACASLLLQVSGGREFFVDSIEVAE